MGDTQTITLFEDDFSTHPNCHNGWSESYVQLLVKAALEQMNYEEDLNTIVFKNYACRAVLDNKRSSEVCYIETQQPGYFFIMRDMVDHINVVYNRWD